MATFITIETTDGVSVVRSVHPTTEAAAANAVEKGWIAVADAVTDDVEPGWFYTAGDSAAEPPVPARVSPTGAPDVASERRETLRLLWRRREADYSALWDNAVVYGRHIEMNCRAAAVDANLTTSSRYETLHAEARWAGSVWQVRHSASLWGTVLSDDRSTWVYHWTGEGGAPNDSSIITLNNDANFDWITWLRETD